ncbi:hypothetical protein DSCO28_63110 [Desulfosarcina ovata subsp. sediminis]|uniref:ABM domain-containing protein n=1 Tax=Desulfosarcina ovata subsp. sediminis TaxID=885957 RepID=A0A5K7ZZN0_9BACT|nr:hypothetical protein [Desulfosarcina ovata]BBO85745.1 hypothetical protein DSCO28_63110 [Desulfosarcina ovata subsp. sediminis]
MDWIEIIQLRSHSHQDKAQALVAFKQLSLPKRIDRLKSARIFRNHTLASDLTIIITWHDEKQQGGKSPLGLQLAAAFSEFGQIYHTTWEYEFTLFDNEKTR